MKNQNRIIAIEDFLQILEDPLVVFDIGCRWGFQEHWKRLESMVQLYGLDADEEEIQSLNSENESEDKSSFDLIWV